MEFFAPLATADGWITFLTLLFLEMVLGIDNLVFIAITTNRLPENKQSLGRRFGLIAAMIMRIILLCFAAWLVSLTMTIFTIPIHIPLVDSNINARDLVLFVGGSYLVYKGIVELREKVNIKEIRAHHDPAKEGTAKKITLPQAIVTIAIMDLVFSLDSVITAVGLSGQLVIMILAVMIAVFIMIIFANPISNFINRNPEMKILALVFIVAVGVKLIAEALGLGEHFHVGDPLTGVMSGTEVFDVMIYFAMGFSLIITSIAMLYGNRVKRVKEEADTSPVDDIEADLSSEEMRVVDVRKRAQYAAEQERLKMEAKYRR